MTWGSVQEKHKYLRDPYGAEGFCIVYSTDSLSASPCELVLEVLEILKPLDDPCLEPNGLY